MSRGQKIMAGIDSSQFFTLFMTIRVETLFPSKTGFSDESGSPLNNFSKSTDFLYSGFFVMGNMNMKEFFDFDHGKVEKIDRCEKS